MAITQKELTSIVNTVLSTLAANAKTIDQLTPVTGLNENDSFELGGGKKVSYGLLSKLLQDKVVFTRQLVFESYISFPTIGRQDTLYVARDRNYTTYAWTGNNYEMTTASVSEDELASKMNKVTILCGY